MKSIKRYLIIVLCFSLFYQQVLLSTAQAFTIEEMGTFLVKLKTFAMSNPDENEILPFLRELSETKFVKDLTDADYEAICNYIKSGDTCKKLFAETNIYFAKMVERNKSNSGLSVTIDDLREITQIVKKIIEPENKSSNTETRTNVVLNDNATEMSTMGFLAWMAAAVFVYYFTLFMFKSCEFHHDAQKDAESRCRLDCINEKDYQFQQCIDYCLKQRR